MSSPRFASPPPELPRDRWGRPLISPPDGSQPVAYTRVTTHAKALEDTYHLNLWRCRTVAVGLATDHLQRTAEIAAAVAAGADADEAETTTAPSLIDRVSAVDDPRSYEGKRELNDVVDAALDAANADARAELGTSLHGWTEVIDRGEDWSHAPTDYLDDLRAYARAIEPFGVVDIEGFCINDDLRTGGTYDRILELPVGGLVAPDGTTVTGHVIADLKTGSSVAYGMTAISQQLAIYANSVGYDHTTGTRTPLDVSREWGIVLHLPAGSGEVELLWVHLAPAYVIASEVTPRVLAWRKKKGLHQTLRLDRTDLRAAIAVAPSYAALRSLYKANEGEWSPELTALAAERRAALEAAA